MNKHNAFGATADDSDEPLQLRKNVHNKHNQPVRRILSMVATCGPYSPSYCTKFEEISACNSTAMSLPINKQAACRETNGTEGMYPSLNTSERPTESAWEFPRLSRLGERMESWKRSELAIRGIRLS
jgi:hypothetical protein